MPTVVILSGTPTWTPTAGQVKGLIPQRVHGTAFSATTKPTATEVLGLAAQIVSEVLAEVGGAIPTSLENFANWVATLGTAAYVELNFFPEQQESSVGEKLYERYKDALGRLLAAVAAAPGAGAVPGDSTMGSMRTPSGVVADYVALYGELLP